ncbi:hypothetical protein HYW18_02335 [Candidatus Uhrbacteria bacterium]|nr:hypothetical protein [Candidatus Uhrbacteria bacterium]
MNDVRKQLQEARQTFRDSMKAVREKESGAFREAIEEMDKAEIPLKRKELLALYG